MALPTYASAYKSLGSVYDPQTKLVNQQMATIDPNMQTALSSLDQAKINAFRDITNQANRRGVLFSGIPIENQAQYVGTKYLPAVAGVRQQAQQQRFGLLDTINRINAQRGSQAQGIVSSAAKNAQDAAYKNAQLQISYARLARSGGSGGLTPIQQINQTNKLQGQYSVTGKSSSIVDNNTSSGYRTVTSTNNGYNFIGPHGKPINMYEYLIGSGSGVNDLRDLLQNGSKYDQAIYHKYKSIKNPAKFYNAVRSDPANKYYGLAKE